MTIDDGVIFLSYQQKSISEIKNDKFVGSIPNTMNKFRIEIVHLAHIEIQLCVELVVDKLPKLNNNNKKSLFLIATSSFYVFKIENTQI